MMRATAEQLARLRENAGLKQKRVGAKKPRIKKRHDELPENQIEGQIIGFLRANGWHCTKQHVGTFRKGNSFFKFGTPGDPDWRCEKPLHPVWYTGRTLPSPECLMILIEIKAAGKKPTAVQWNRIEDLRRNGFMACWFDDYDGFIKWYERVMREWP